jgi:FkbM family methyltransferase
MTIQVADGLKWAVEPGTDDGHGLSEHEAGITKTVLDLLPPEPAGGRKFPYDGGVLLDIGAHVGHYALRAAARGHRVIAVEANPATAGRLFENIIRNDLAARVRIIAAPAWDEAEPLKWVPWRSGLAGLRDGSGRDMPDPEGDLLGVVLDDVLGTEPRIDVVKIDAEGSDLHVLRGLRATLRRCRPVLWIEDHQFLGTYILDDLTRLLAELGYDCGHGGEWQGLTYWLCRPRNG